MYNFLISSSRKQYKLLLILFFSIFLQVERLSALQLQIEDQYKLIRIIAEINEPQNIVVETEQEIDSIRLEHSEGILDTIAATPISKNKFLINSVAAGNWKIVVKPKEVKILFISIDQE